MGTEIHPMGMQILGLSEVENRGVIEDLIATPALAPRNYDIVHYDSPDKRGIDVALIYQPEFFKVYNSKSYELTVPGRDDFFSRDQLLVSGVADGDTIHVIVAHWPSRSGGEKRSQPARIEAGKLGRHIVDSLLTENANARIVYMGDLNDDPVNASVKRFLKSDGRKEAAVGDMLYNPMVDLYNKGIGTLAWRDSWNLFDQTILSPGLVSGDGGRYRFFGAKVFNKPYLRQQDGNFAGYPFRTYVGNNYRGGYSDHFPVYVILVREAE
jgi:exonuclease III